MVWLLNHQLYSSQFREAVGSRIDGRREHGLLHSVISDGRKARKFPVTPLIKAFTSLSRTLQHDLIPIYFLKSCAS